MGPYRDAGLARSIVVDLDSAVPLYRQIADGVRALIARGALKDGDELPSVRKLGEMLGVNLNTVAKAYRVLAEERVVSLEHGKSARVSAPPELEEPIDDATRTELFHLVGRMRLRRAARDDVRELFDEALARFYPDDPGGDER